MRLRPTLVLAVVLPLLALTGCAAKSSIAVNTYPGVPPGFAQTINVFNAQPIGVWVHAKTLLAVITVGSGSCPPIPVAITAKDAKTISLEYVTSPNSSCTADISPTTNEFTIPAGIDISQNVTLLTHFDFTPPVDYTTIVHN
jgi:hypothetical protein